MCKELNIRVSFGWCKDVKKGRQPWPVLDFGLEFPDQFLLPCGGRLERHAMPGVGLFWPKGPEEAVHPTRRRMEVFDGFTRWGSPCPYATPTSIIEKKNHAPVHRKRLKLKTV